MKLSKISTGGEEKWLGSEPLWTNQDDMSDQDKRVALMGALNWYAYFTDNKQAKTFLLEYMQGVGRSKEEIALIKSLSDSQMQSQTGKLARMMSRGYKPTDEVRERFIEQFKELLSKAKQNAEENKVEDAPDVPKVSIQDRIREKASEEMAELDGMIDDFIANKCKTNIDMENYLKSRNMSSIVAKRVCEAYIDQSKEIADTIAGVDEQLVEGYSHFTKPELKRYKEFLDSIIVGANKLSVDNKPVRKKRKVKEKPASVVVAKMKYLKEFPELNLVSIAPEKVVGATQVWTYNTKTKTLSVYNAYNALGITVKGTTLQNFEEASSISKRLRKPEVAIKEVLTGGKIVLRKVMEKLTTKESAANGRMNDDTVIVRVA